MKYKVLKMESPESSGKPSGKRRPKGLKKAGVLGSGCLVLFGLPFFLAGSFVIGLFCKTYADFKTAASWKPVPVKILEAELVAHRGDDSTSYSVKARYKYKVDGKEYTGERVSPEMGSSSGSHHRRHFNVLEKHRASGESFSAWVNPENPSESMLFKEISVMTWALLPFGMLFALVGLGVSSAGVYAIVSVSRKKKRLLRNPERPWRAETRWLHGFDLHSQQGKSVIWSWVVTMILCLFISIFVIAIRGESSSTGLRILMGVLTALPLLSAVWAVYATLRWRKYGNVTLALSEMPIVPGRTLKCIIFCGRRVHFEGSFKLQLICQRTVQRGKNSHVERLYEDNLEVERDLGIGQQVTAVPVSMDIPLDQPGLGDPNDQTLCWKLQVKAATPGIDFSVSFLLPVFHLDDERFLEHRPESVVS